MSEKDFSDEEMRKYVLSQRFVNNHYRGYLTRDEAFFYTEAYFKKNLDMGLITREEFEMMQRFNQIAYDNNQQNIPIEPAE